MSQPQMRRRRHGEVLGGHPAPAAAQGHRTHDRTDRRSQRAGIDKLPAAEPRRVGSPAAATRPPTIGMMSVVVLPMSRRARRETSRATSVALAIQLAAATRTVCCRATAAGRNAHRFRRPTARLRKRRAEGVEHERHPFPFGRETIRQLGGHCDRHGRRRAKRVGRLRQNRGQSMRLAPERERALEHQGLGPSASSRRAALMLAPPTSQPRIGPFIV